jgi:hypothetical protein
MTSFLDYYKIILDKVSFDPVLFQKEYQKAKRNLRTDEIRDLNWWLQSRGFQINVGECRNTAIMSGNYRQNILSLNESNKK